jgi:alpha-methylacyl-CoA racemase
VTQPAPAPRYSSSATLAPAMATTRNDAAILEDLGFSPAEIAELGL